MLQTIAKLFKKKTKKNMSIAMFGLDAAGKTTVSYKLKLGEIVTMIPTIGFNVEQVDIDSQHHVTAWDVGGRGKMCLLFRHYIENMDAVFFILDSNDKDRMEAARYEMTYFSKIAIDFIMFFSFKNICSSFFQRIDFLTSIVELKVLRVAKIFQIVNTTVKLINKFFW